VIAFLPLVSVAAFLLGMYAATSADQWDWGSVVLDLRTSGFMDQLVMITVRLPYPNLPDAHEEWHFHSLNLLPSPALSLIGIASFGVRAFSQAVRSMEPRELLQEVAP
jgi:hypothetical protein